MKHTTRSRKRKALISLREAAKKNWTERTENLPPGSPYKNMTSRAVTAIDEALNNPKHMNRRYLPWRINRNYYKTKDHHRNNAKTYRILPPKVEGQNLGPGNPGRLPAATRDTRQTANDNHNGL